MEKEDLVNAPTHYTKYNVVLESIDVTDLFSFNLGCAIKYAVRFRDKDDPVMDLEKAIWYTKRIMMNDHKFKKAMKQIKKHKCVLRIFRDKSKDAMTIQTFDVLLESLKDKTFQGYLDMLQTRLNFLRISNRVDKAEE